MKRWILFFCVLCLTISLSACGLSVLDRDDLVDDPIQLYYVSDGDISYQSEHGPVLPESRPVSISQLDIATLLDLYLSGPEAVEGKLPFSENLEFSDYWQEGARLYLQVSNHWSDLSPLEEKLAEACIVLTVTQLPDVEQVCILKLDGMQMSAPQYLRAEDFLLQDDTATSNETTLKLYFSDANGRYLLEETRSRENGEADVLASYIVRELIVGPQRSDAISSLPEGTNLLGVDLSQGVCTVNFSEAFVTNMPKSHTQARVAVFSVVNSLTELPQVESVRLLCVGREIGDYAGLDLSQILYREELGIWNDNQPSTVLNTNLYVPGKDGRLAPVPVSIRQSAGKMGAEAVMGALLSFKPANGYENPFPDGTALVDQSLINGLCTVTFNNAFVLRSTDEEAMELTIRSVVATLCGLEGVEQVQVEIYDKHISIDGIGIPLKSDPSWYLP